MLIKSLGSWRQSICLLRFQSPIVKDTKKGAQKWHEGTKQLIRQLGEQHLQNHVLIGVATLVPQTNLPETPSYTEGETLKVKSEGFQEDHMGWLQKKGLLFLPGYLHWKLVNSLHANTNLEEKALQKITRKVLQRNRPPNNYKANGLLLSHLPINQPSRSSKTPAGPAQSNDVGRT